MLKINSAFAILVVLFIGLLEVIRIWALPPVITNISAAIKFFSQAIGL